MKYALLLLVSALFGLSDARIKKPHIRFPEVEITEPNAAKKQKEIDSLFQGLSNIEEPHEPVEFEYDDPRYYKNKAVIGKFMEAWNEGFINKNEFFSLYHYKNRHDTYRFFDILFYARDYNTFYKICQWAKKELHPVQFVYGVTAAIIHREDLHYILPPTLYEVLPQYFVPSDIIQGAQKASILGFRERQFDVNSTGFEYSWYKGKTYESFKSGPKWNKFDMESRLSYFTEDVDMADFVAKTAMAYAPWISDEKYPEVNNYRKGESLFHFYRHLLTKYNLERYANYLPPTMPLNYKSIVKTGYNPHLSTLHGQPFTTRPDRFYPFISNPLGVHDLFITKMNYDEVTDLQSYKTLPNASYVDLEENWNGLDKLGRLVYGATSPEIRQIYKPYHYQAFDALDKAVVASNAVDLTGSSLSNYMTEIRDPVYFRVLASVYEVFNNYFSKLPPYTADQLEYPGVKVMDFQFSDLTTYFEKHVFEITNSVPLKSFQGYNYTVTKTRLAHKPFSFNVTIDSDKKRDVIIRVYLTPSLDANNRPLSVAEKVKQAVPFFFYHADLKKGEHTLKGDSDKGFYQDGENQLRAEPNYSPLASMKRGYSGGMEQDKCSAPSHLILPKGGRPFSLFVIVTHFDFPDQKMKTPCSWDLIYGLHETIDFPTNRRVVPRYFEQAENILFKDITINHDENYSPDSEPPYEHI